MSNTQSRLEKLEKLDDLYPRDFPGRETISSILFQYNNNIFIKNIVSSLNPSKPIYKIAGRISARRDHRNNVFFDIFDQTASIQLHAKWEKGTGEIDDNFREGITNKVWNNIQICDIGDMIGVEGNLSQNSRGELLLLISNFTLLAKALKDPPANFHGVKNPEHKYRHREQDLMSSADSREVFKKRAEIVFEIRKYLNERDFIEIETPVLQNIYGGATARPFVTHHQSLGQDYFLGISSELYLKRALVGGFDRVYSISRCFRNEGISPEHNPEFTNLEIFETCKTASDMAKFTENLIENIAHSINSLDSLILPIAEFKSQLLSSNWPLSRNWPQDESLAEAWEFFIGGMEIASGASDLNDPQEQTRNFTKVMEANNPNHNPYDQNYIEALMMGALPWAGVGIGIDRLCMLLLEKKNIRDVMMFPLLKDKE